MGALHSRCCCSSGRSPAVRSGASKPADPSSSAPRASCEELLLQQQQQQDATANCDGVDLVIEGLVNGALCSRCKRAAGAPLALDNHPLYDKMALERVHARRHQGRHGGSLQFGVLRETPDSPCRQGCAQAAAWLRLQLSLAPGIAAAGLDGARAALSERLDVETPGALLDLSAQARVRAALGRA